MSQWNELVVGFLSPVSCLGLPQVDCHSGQPIVVSIAMSTDSRVKSLNKLAKQLLVTLRTDLITMFELAECKFELTSTWNGSIFSCYYMCVWYPFVQRFQSKCTVVWYTVIVLQTVSSTKTDSKSHVCNCESLKFCTSHFPLKKV